MPLNSTRGAGSAKGFGLTSGGLGPIDVDYLVVAGGGGGQNGGGGAGGMRTSFPGGTKLNMKTGSTYNITVGGGGDPGSSRGTDSSAVLETTISSTAGGRGGPSPNPLGDPGWNPNSAFPGGSGGGAATGNPQAGGGNGNAGGYSPPEGNGGGQNYPTTPGGGGGGGRNGGGFSAPHIAGPLGGYGGAGAPNLITGTDITYAGGGGAFQGSPGAGGGPAANQGGGGTSSTSGGSGIVVLRAPAKSKLTIAPGTNTVTTAPDGTYVAKFTVTGTLKHG
jgi:hypothetical protein